jgi:hypothetical protein
MSFDAWQKRAEDNILCSINREIAIRYEKRVQAESQEATANTSRKELESGMTLQLQ